MTDIVRTAIVALETLTGGALKTEDEATLDRLQELAERCVALISDEMERRNPVISRPR